MQIGETFWTCKIFSICFPALNNYFFPDRFENVCLVSKPCIETSINGPSLWRRYLKFSVKLAIYGDLKKQVDEKMPVRKGGRQRANRAKLERGNQIKQGAAEHY